MEDKIKDLEEKKDRPKQKQKERKKSFTSESKIPEKEKRITQSLQKKRLRYANIISEVEGSEKIHSYKIVAAKKQAQNLKRLWTKISYDNPKLNKAKLPLIGTIEQRSRRIFFPCKIKNKQN